MEQHAPSDEDAGAQPHKWDVVAFGADRRARDDDGDAARDAVRETAYSRRHGICPKYSLEVEG